MQKMTIELFFRNKGDVVRRRIPVGLVGIVKGSLDREPRAIVMMDPDDEVCRELYGVSEVNPYVELPLEVIRPVPEEFNRIFGK